MSKNRAIAHLIAWLMLALIFISFSCESLKPVMHAPVSEATGTVISVDGDNVLVAYEVINKEKGSQASNWFNCPGHQFQKGDSYPDSTKYNPKP